MQSDDRINSGRCLQSTKIPNVQHASKCSSTLPAQRNRGLLSVRSNSFDFRGSNTSGTPTAETVSRLAVSRPRSSRKKHLPTSCRPIRLLLFAEELRIDVSNRARPLHYLTRSTDTNYALIIAWLSGFEN